jgi:hypothetical protein
MHNVIIWVGGLGDAQKYIKSGSKRAGAREMGLAEQSRAGEMHAWVHA